MAEDGDQPEEEAEEEVEEVRDEQGRLVIQPPPIFEKEEECEPCKGGAPGWMATFADMATLLMAFFVLILSFADTELPKFDQINGSLKMAFGIKDSTNGCEFRQKKSISRRIYPSGSPAHRH